MEVFILIGEISIKVARLDKDFPNRISISRSCVLFTAVGLVQRDYLQTFVSLYRTIVLYRDDTMVDRIQTLASELLSGVWTESDVSSLIKHKQSVIIIITFWLRGPWSCVYCKSIYISISRYSTLLTLIPVLSLLLCHVSGSRVIGHLRHVYQEESHKCTRDTCHHCNVHWLKIFRDSSNVNWCTRGKSRTWRVLPHRG